MKYTNKFGLPDAFARAIANDPYTRGDSDFSATSLQNPARATVLLEQNDVEVDITSRVAATIGQGVHSILERAARPNIDIIETRYHSDFLVDGVTYKVSAQIDILETDSGVLSDWKTTKAFAFHKKSGGGNKLEWIYQMNVGLELLRRNGLDAKKLQIIGLLKDWQRQKLCESGYPQAEIVAVEVKMLPREEIVAWIENRIRAVVAARKELPLCTSKENWGGNRCGQWCDASSVCDQYQQSIKTGILVEPKESA